MVDGLEGRMTGLRITARTRRWAAAVAIGGLSLTGCGTASTGGSGGGGASGEMTLWTHNAGNPEELGVVQQIVKDWNAANSTKIKLQAFPQQSYNDSVVAAATA